jgi:hypothetical protein
VALTEESNVGNSSSWSPKTDMKKALWGARHPVLGEVQKIILLLLETKSLTFVFKWSTACHLLDGPEAYQ